MMWVSQMRMGEPLEGSRFVASHDLGTAVIRAWPRSGLPMIRAQP
jgi:hypothetical protein